MVTVQFSFFFLASMSICFTSTLCTAEEITDENVRKLAEANNELAFNIYQSLSLEEGNIFFSPLSLSTAFGMLYYGARGDTAKDLRETLGYKAAHLPEELVHSTFKHYLTQTLPSQDPNAYVFSSANAALLNRNLNVLPSYETEIQDYYQASVKKVDFMIANREIIQEINMFVKNKTNGKIEQLLSALDPSTVFIILNAVYFKGIWEIKFDKNLTEPKKFYNNGKLSEAKEIPMMTLQEKFPYMTDYKLGADVLEMPYKGGNISMIVLLPHERDGLDALENNLSLETLKNIRSKLIKTKVVLFLPKFKLKYLKDMTTDFADLGAEGILSPGADFSGMAKSENVYVNGVLHKAVIEVNEEGSEAAAVTGFVFFKMGQAEDYPPLMVVDHPFLFFIIDRRNDMILFVGRVTLFP